MINNQGNDTLVSSLTLCKGFPQILRTPKTVWKHWIFHLLMDINEVKPQNLAPKKKDPFPSYYRLTSTPGALSITWAPRQKRREPGIYLQNTFVETTREILFLENEITSSNRWDNQDYKWWKLFISSFNHGLCTYTQHCEKQKKILEFK